MRSMRRVGCTVWPVSSVNSQHAGTQQACWESCQGPRSFSPSHQCESPWADLSWNPHLFQPLPKTRVGVNLKVSLRRCSARGLSEQGTRWPAYLWLLFACHGLDQLEEVRPVALGVPAGFVQWRQPLALLHVVHCRRGKRIRRHSLTRQPAATWPHSL